MQKKNKLISLTVFGAALGFMLTSCSSLAGSDDDDDWPTRDIEIIVPFGAGGDTDFNARMYADRLEEELGTSVTVSNVEGQGGAAGAAQVRDADPDGYTILFYHGAVAVNEATGAANFGLDDFEFVATAAASPGELVTVREDMGFEDLDDLVEYSQENPDELRVSADIGATTHVMALQLQDAGADINIVSSGGSSDRVASLLGGHVDVIFNPYGNISDYLENGDFAALANVSGERAEEYSDIPTAEEQGYGELNFTNYYFFAMPEGAPDHAVEQFAEAAEAVSQQED